LVVPVLASVSKFCVYADPNAERLTVPAAPTEATSVATQPNEASVIAPTASAARVRMAQPLPVT
jgi:hypothetical protein